ncbi:MAG: MltA-interacting MipA family [Rhodospirillaceae bacterium]|nr:MAG: MltA-interacting MipA family [Rhodospirillaceae bacterium]TNC96904.1 MAG: MltA-interacting MipA family protein [Stygiobacter sp.]
MKILRSPPAVLSFSAVLSLALVSTALAEEVTPASGKPPSDWAYKIGAGMVVMPTYEGSKHYEVNPLPVAEVSWRNAVSLSVTEGAKVTIRPLADEGFSVSGGVGYWLGRKESADKDYDDALRGLGDLSGNAIGKLGVEYQYKAVSAGLNLARDIGGDRDGTTITMKGGYKIYQGQAFKVRAELSTTWADDNYMQGLFGITPEQAGKSVKHYSVHDAQAGMKDVKIGVNAGYDITSSVNLFARVEAGRLLGDAADSPIVKNQGNENQFTTALGVVYRF